MLENYRIYVVFHLPSLKALDGIAVVQYGLFHIVIIAMYLQYTHRFVFAVSRR